MFKLSLWDRIKVWFEYNIWCWIVDEPMSDMNGGHCKGRRSKKNVYCPDCDGEK